MLNNDILRRIRYALDLSDSRMIEIFDNADQQVTRNQVCNWLSREDDPAFQKCSDAQFSVFLNGLIIDRRGPGDGSQPEPVQRLTNNMIFKKLRIALNLKAEDILEIMTLAGFSLSKHELSSLFRKPEHKHYRECKDQTLRRFLKGMQLKYRPGMEG
ncbi:MAG: DUF1456 family protein [Candidatus Sabulitectum sp.]|nr:DUF1456 family protein [Candidatus Sabulitectum sp.]